jgi:asparagine synthase (glutamine-hydrolysing)
MDLDESVIRAVCDAMDEPFGDSSVFPTYLLSKVARSQVTVCLSGDGGDEVFGGYDTYKAYKIAAILPACLIRSIRPVVGLLPDSERKVTSVFKAKRFLRDFGQEPIRRHLDWMATFNDVARKELLRDAFLPAGQLLELPRAEGLLALQLADIRYYLPEDILKKVDLASMLHSLEVRVPFLDYRLVPLVLSLPPEFLLRGLQTKWLLRRIAHRYLPWRIIHRPKRGFTSPISRWIRSSQWIQDYIGSDEYLDHGMLDLQMVRQMLAEHLAGHKDWARQLWLIFIFNYWVHRNLRCGGR